MTVLIDPPRWPAHDTVWSHLVSDDSLAELHAFAAANDIPPRGFDLDHYDVPASRYQDLIAAGATPVDGSELVKRLIASGLRITARERTEKRPSAIHRDDERPQSSGVTRPGSSRRASCPCLRQPGFR